MTPVLEVEPVVVDEVQRRPPRLRSGAVIAPGYALWLVEHGRGDRLHPETREDLVAEVVAAAERALETLRPIFEAAARAIGEVVEVWRPRLVAAGLVPVVVEVQGDDVAGRALDLRRRRNTGPKVWADPRRNRR